MPTLVPVGERRPLTLFFAIVGTVLLLASVYLTYTGEVHWFLLLSSLLNVVFFWYLYLFTSKADLPKMYADIQREKRARQTKR